MAMTKKSDSFQVSPDEFKDRIREHWNRPETRNPNTSRFGTASEMEAWKRFFSKELGDERLRILDAGTGTGFLSLPLAELGHEVVGIDLAPGMISVARKTAEDRRLDLDLRIGDVESLDFDCESFDAVVSRWVLWTLPDPEKAISEWMRVLKPGGRAYAFGVARSAEKEGLCRRIKRNLGMFLITAVERRNAWVMRSRYGKDLDGTGLEGKLPLHHVKPDSNAKEIEFFEKYGFVDITNTTMVEVNTIRWKEQKGKPLRYKLAWGDHGSGTYCLSGRKPGNGLRMRNGSASQ